MDGQTGSFWENIIILLEVLLKPNYWTKHHAGKHHRNIRKEFLTPVTVLEMLQLEQSRALQQRSTH